MPDFLHQLQDIIEEGESFDIGALDGRGDCKSYLRLTSGPSTRPCYQKLSEVVLGTHRHGVDEGVLVT